MNKKILITSLLGVTLGFANVNGSNNSIDNSVKKIINKKNNSFLNVISGTVLESQITPLYKKGEIEGVVKDLGDIYAVYIWDKKTNGKGTFFITKDKKYLLIGKAVNNKDGSVFQIYTPVNKKIVEQGISFTFGKGKKDIYVVTDPECPFCRKMEKLIGKKLSDNYKVHIILYPLPFHSNAKAMSYYILAGKTQEEKAKRFKEILSGDNSWSSYQPSAEEKERFDKELELSKKAVNQLHANGTPSVYNDKFDYINWTLFLNKKQ